MRKLLTFIYKLLVVLSVIGGAISLYNFVMEGEEFELTFSIEERSKIIEKSTPLTDLKVLYQDIEVPSLFWTYFQITNTGNKAITKEFVFDKIEVLVQEGNLIVNVSSDASTSSTNKSLKINFDLINPGESLRFHMLTTIEPIFTLRYKIREIKEIKQWDKLENPPLNKRIFEVSVFWALLFVTAFMMLIDSIFLIKEDVKLGRLFSMIKGIQYDKSFDKDQALNELGELYAVYSTSLPFVFVSKDLLLSEVSKKIEELDTTKERDLYILYKFTNALVRNGNLYNIRSTNIFTAPLLLLASIVGAFFNIFI